MCKKFYTWFTKLAKSNKWTYQVHPLLKNECKIAAQVLSSTVSKVLLAYDPPEATETSHFCSLIDCFFDSMNVQNTLSHEFEWKPKLAPFTSKIPLSMI